MKTELWGISLGRWEANWVTQDVKIGFSPLGSADQYDAPYLYTLFCYTTHGSRAWMKWHQPGKHTLGQCCQILFSSGLWFMIINLGPPLGDSHCSTLHNLTSYWTVTYVTTWTVLCYTVSRNFWNIACYSVHLVNVMYLHLLFYLLCFLAERNCDPWISSLQLFQVVCLQYQCHSLS